MFKYFILIFVSFSLLSCQSVKDSVSLKKKNNRDEFLVEKKKPLVLPPSFSELPKPEDQQILKEESKNENQIQKIINDEDLNSKNKTEDQSIDLSLEESILKKIKKN